MKGVKIIRYIYMGLIAVCAVSLNICLPDTEETGSSSDSLCGCSHSETVDGETSEDDFDELKTQKSSYYIESLKKDVESEYCTEKNITPRSDGHTVSIRLKPTMHATSPFLCNIPDEVELLNLDLENISSIHPDFLHSNLDNKNIRELYIYNAKFDDASSWYFLQHLSNSIRSIHILNTNFHPDILSILSEAINLRDISIFNSKLDTWDNLSSLPKSLCSLSLTNTNCPIELLEKLNRNFPKLHYKKQKIDSTPEDLYISQLSNKTKLELIKTYNLCVRLENKEEIISDADLLFIDGAYDDCEEVDVEYLPGLYKVLDDLYSASTLLSHMNIEEKMRFLEVFTYELSNLNNPLNMKVATDLLHSYNHPESWKNDVLDRSNIKFVYLIQESLDSKIGSMDNCTKRELRDLLIKNRDKKLEITEEEFLRMRYLRDLNDFQAKFRLYGSPFKFGISKIDLGTDEGSEGTIDILEINEEIFQYFSSIKELPYLSDLSLKEIRMRKETWPVCIPITNSLLRLDLSYTNIPRETFYNTVKHLKNLETLNLSDIKFHEGWLSFKEHLPYSLLELDLTDTNVDTANIETLQYFDDLNWLSLRGTKIKKWDCLSFLPTSLRYIDLSNTAVNEKDIRTLLKCIPLIKTIVLGRELRHLQYDDNFENSNINIIFRH